MATGDIFINDYIVTPTISGESSGTISVSSISGGTAPYTIQWYGPSPYPYNLDSGSTLNISNLSGGTYTGRCIDSEGLSADTEIGVSAYTAPTFSATITDDSCIVNPNKSCEFTVWSAGTDTAYLSASSFNYLLYRNGSLFDQATVSSGTTSPNQGDPARGGYHVFSGLTNGQYSFVIERSSSFTLFESVPTSYCTGVTSDGRTTSGADVYQSFSGGTSGYGTNWNYSLATHEINTTGFTTGLFSGGIVTDATNHWFFTGNSQTGALNEEDYTLSNPNSARTTSNEFNYYLGVTGATDMAEGYNWGPNGGGKPDTDGDSADLEGNVIAGAAFRGYFYYNNNINRFVMWDNISGDTAVVTGLEYGWKTISPLLRNGTPKFTRQTHVSSGSPCPSIWMAEGLMLFSQYNKPTSFFTSYKHPGNDDTIKMVDANNLVADLNKTVPALGSADIYTSNAVAQSGTPLNYMSSCQFGNYTHDITLFVSGDTASLELTSLVLASIRDPEGIYGISGTTHQLTLDINHLSGVTINYNGGGNTSNSFQRDLYGSPISSNSSAERSNEHVTLNTVRTKSDVKTINRKTRREEKIIFDYIKEENLKTYGGNTSPLRQSSNLGLQTKEFSSVVLRNPGREFVALGSSSPYLSGGSMSLQGSIRVRIERRGEQGELFKIKMTDTFGDTTYATEAVLDYGDTCVFDSDYEINFNLLDSNTWSGAVESAPSWVLGTELEKFCGGVSVGYGTTHYDANLYYRGFTGDPANNTIIQRSDVKPIFRKTAFTLTSSATTNVIKTKDCDYYPNCEVTVPQSRPLPSASFQTLSEPSFILSGAASGTSGELSAQTIYNLSSYTGTNLTIFLTGDTSDILTNQAYLKLYVYPYEYQKERFSTNPDYRYLFNTTNQIPDTILSNPSPGFSASTFFPFSAFSTGSSWQFLVKPSYLFRDKSSTKGIYIDTSEITDTVTYNSNLDYILTLVNPPEQISLINANINFQPNATARLETQTVTATNIPAFSANSAYTFSGVTLLSNPTSNLLVTLNGVVLKEDPGNVISGGTPVSAFTNIDYRRTASNPTRITFAPETVKDGDVIQVIYPTDNKRSYYKQAVTVGTPGTSTGATIYHDTYYYYINLDYAPLGAIALAYNGQILAENSDFQRVTPTRIQLLSLTYDATALGSSDVFTFYYLTQYTVVGQTTTSEPVTSIEYYKTLGFKESLKQITYVAGTGEMVQELAQFYTAADYGTKNHTFTISVPSAGTYNYRVIATRYYPLLGDKEITTSRVTEDVVFEMTRQSFFSPYKLPRNVREINPRGGGTY